MGKRSRRQRQGGGSHAGSRRGELRQRAARAGAAAERNIKARPPAPWDPFPLTELGILLGLICLAIGFFVHGDLGRALLAAGFTLAALGGLDTMLREHFNGYRSHAGLLAGILSLLALIVSTAIARIGIAPRAAIAIGVFALVYPTLRRGFIRRSGGRRA
ncbi:MAG: hypothetical protein JJE27_06470 [Thermoleophilia bacterium]|nr:hypothetical protein [Thermoleophilia bacterium]